VPKFSYAENIANNRLNNVQIHKHLSFLNDYHNQGLFIRRTVGLGDVLIAGLCTSVLRSKTLNKFRVGFITDPKFIDIVKKCGFVNQIYSDQNFSGFFTLNLQGQVDYLPICREDNRIDLMGRAIGLRESEIPRQFPVLSRAQWAIYSHKWQSFFINQNLVIGLVPLAYAPIRSWPNWRRFLTLGLKNNLKFVLLHNRKLKTVSDNRILNITGCTNPVEFMSILSACDAVVSVDTSAVHVCGFLGIPTIALFGPINPVLRTCYYPDVETIWLNDQFDCCPCYDWQTHCCHKKSSYRGCMKNINPKMVLDKLQSIL